MLGVLNLLLSALNVRSKSLYQSTNERFSNDSRPKSLLRLITTGKKQGVEPTRIPNNYHYRSLSQSAGKSHVQGAIAVGFASH